MDRRGWFTVGVGAIGLGIAALVASRRPLELWHEPAGGPVATGPEPFPTDLPTVSVMPGSGGLDLPAVGTGAERVLTVVALVVVAAIILHQLRRLLLALRPPPEPDFAVVPAVAAMLDDDAGQRAALLRGSPRNAIVACWVRLERAVESAGLRRDPAETSTELTRRVLAAHLVDTAAIDTLADLYREARFSSHPLDEGHRTRAIAALDAVHAELARPAVPA